MLLRTEEMFYMSLIGTKKHTILGSVSANFRLSWFPRVLEKSPKPQEANAEKCEACIFPSNIWRGNQTHILIHCELSLKGVCIHMIARYHKRPSFNRFEHKLTYSTNAMRKTRPYL